MTASFPGAEKWLDSIGMIGIRMGLERTRELFRRAGEPGRDLFFIHVAGSNGKGSVCAYLEAAFRAAGFRTGFYSSPHLISPRERFRINGESVSGAALEEAAERLFPEAEAMKAEGRPPTYFEVVTVLAAMIFRKAACQVVLWETGMGGRLDSTNVMDTQASVITGISLEHRQILGDTLEKIAFEKAGIIKAGKPVFCAASTPEAALEVIRARAKSLNSPFFLSAPLSGAKPEIRLPDGENGFLQTFHLADGTVLASPLAGPHQRRNAALAFTVLRHFAPRLGFSAEKAAEAFRSVRWDARFQFLPGLLVDGGHNPEGIAALADTLEELFPGRKFHFLFGAFSDKDTASSLARLAPLAESFTFLPLEGTDRASRSGRSLGEELARSAPGIPWDEASLEEALTREGGDRILCGSLHLCGDALAFLKKRCIVGSGSRSSFL